MRFIIDKNCLISETKEKFGNEPIVIPIFIDSSIKGQMVKGKKCLVFPLPQAEIVRNFKGQHLLRKHPTKSIRIDVSNQRSVSMTFKRNLRSFFKLCKITSGKIVYQFIAQTKQNNYVVTFTLHE